MRRAALTLAVLLPLAGCRDWRTRVDPARAAAEPEQAPLPGAPPIRYEARGHAVTLTPRASYRITGYAADTSRRLLDRWDFVMPLDVALVWGPVADPAVLQHLRFHLSGRYVSWRWDGELPRRAVPLLPTHIANQHLIPATDDVAHALDRVRAGDLVRLRGQLVDVEIRDRAGQLAARMATSLTREDVGSGACEIVWVEEAEVDPEDG